MNSMVCDCILGIEEIKKRIPHRYPFLFVDKVISIDKEAGIIQGIKSVSINEPFFGGHFPDKPIMPGVLIVEALAQLGAILISEDRKGLKVLANISNFKFRRPVFPGDVLQLHLQTTHVSAIGGRCSASASVNGEVCAEGQMTFSIMKDQPKENIEQ